MKYPEYIKENSKIGVPAPSCGAYNELYVKRFENAKKKMENLGYKVELSENIAKSEKCRSASAKERGEELNKMFENQEIDAIICAAGGEFLMECLEYVDFEKIAKNPKWVQGFSNPTTLIYPITTKLDISTIYANNFGSFGAENWDKSTIDNLDVLTGKTLEVQSYEYYEEESIEKVTGLESDNLTEKVEWKVYKGQEAKIRGRVIAGCFEDICLLAGTKYDGLKEFKEKYKKDGIVFFFDNCELSKEELIRSLWKLNELNYFDNVNGIVFGRNGVEKSYLEYTMEEAIKDSVLGALNIPIVYDADVSHKSPCMTLVNGAIANIEVKNTKGNIKFELI